VSTTAATAERAGWPLELIDDEIDLLGERYRVSLPVVVPTDPQINLSYELIHVASFNTASATSRIRSLAVVPVAAPP